jgi:hypothetical protein
MSSEKLRRSTSETSVNFHQTKRRSIPEDIFLTWRSLFAKVLL